MTAELRKRMIPVEAWFVLRTVGKNAYLCTLEYADDHPCPVGKRGELHTGCAICMLKM